MFQAGGFLSIYDEKLNHALLFSITKLILYHRHLELSFWLEVGPCHSLWLYFLPLIDTFPSIFSIII